MMRRGRVHFQGQDAGLIEQRDGEYVFTYHPKYLEQASSKPISFSLPLTPKPYRQKTMFPFFDGLIPEGWLLDIVSKNWKVGQRDRMGLLLAVCRDCVGAVQVFEESAGENE